MDLREIHCNGCHEKIIPGASLQPFAFTACKHFYCKLCGSKIKSKRKDKINCVACQAEVPVMLIAQSNIHKAPIPLIQLLKERNKRHSSSGLQRLSVMQCKKYAGAVFALKRLTSIKSKQDALASKLKRQLEHLSKDNQHLRQQLAEKEEASTNYKKQLAYSEKENQKLKQCSAKHDESQIKLEQQLAALQNDNHKLRQYCRKQETGSKVKQERDCLETENERLKRQCKSNACVQLRPGILISVTCLIAAQR